MHISTSLHMGANTVFKFDPQGWAIRGSPNTSKQASRARPEGHGDSDEDIDDEDSDDEDSDDEDSDDEDSDDEDSDDEDSILSDEELEPFFNDQEFVEYLERLHTQILSRWRTPIISDIPNLRPNIHLQAHQIHAVSKAGWAIDSRFKGMILADPPGLGKTLSALAMISRFNSIGDGPSVIIAPLSCCQQWMEEINKFFQDGTMPAICLANHKTTVNRLYEYKIVITSYNQVSAEFARLQRYTRALEGYAKGRIKLDDLPKRPNVTLLSSILMTGAIKPLGPLLILDEAHAIKNTRSRTFAAIYELRQRFKTCIMMTGTPLDNTWVDAFAYFSVLQGHNIGSLAIHRLAFSGESKRKGSQISHGPQPSYIKRLVQMMDAVTLRRPADIVTRDLPAMSRIPIEYQSTSPATDDSNHHFDEFKRLRRMPKKDREEHHPWAKFVQARQCAYHPLLTQLHDIEQKSQIDAMRQDESADDIAEDQHQERLAKWYEAVKKGDNWMSDRTFRLMNLIASHRERYPDNAMVVMDESVFFLDIVEIAVSKYFDEVEDDNDGKIPVFRYDGRLGSDERGAVRARFNAAQGCRLLLASRGTGGEGLNLQSANVLIRCGPWWKVSWEDQAEGRIYRWGQENLTFVYELHDRECKVDEYLRTTRNNKNLTNTKVMEGCTHEDDRAEPRMRHIR
ncbi:hypothetical protein FSHL1_004409 [Fusarium sambucinum]